MFLISQTLRQIPHIELSWTEWLVQQLSVSANRARNPSSHSKTQIVIFSEMDQWVFQANAALVILSILKTQQEQQPGTNLHIVATATVVNYAIDSILHDSRWGGDNFCRMAAPIQLSDLTLQTSKHISINTPDDDSALAAFRDIHASLTLSHCVIYVNSEERAVWLRNALEDDDFTVARNLRRFIDGTNQVIVWTDSLHVIPLNIHPSAGRIHRIPQVIVHFDVPSNPVNYACRLGHVVRKDDDGHGSSAAPSFLTPVLSFSLVRDTDEDRTRLARIAERFSIAWETADETLP
jgi:superfamily II DNA/RNA helicase